MNGVPSGAVTFLFTDIEGSTALWDRAPRLMSDALARHDALVQATIERHGGFVFSVGGDGFGAAFGSAPAAVGAAVDVQVGIEREAWDPEAVIRVRIGLHTGAAEERAANYFGPAVNLAARIADAAQGGQIVVSAATAALASGNGWRLVDLGAHRLEGLGRPERVYRLVGAGMVEVDRPLRHTYRAVGNLPNQRASLIGRDADLAHLDAILQPGALVTVTGVGGVGKTRLAVAAARNAADRFADGAWLVELAELVAPGDLAPAVAGGLRLSLNGDSDVAAAITSALQLQERLVVFDNCEHVLDAAAAVIDAIGRHCPGVAVMATTREPLGLPGERIVPLRPLLVDGGGRPSEAVRLFCERATGVLGHFEPTADELATVDDICRRLDGLPLAIELAAARLPTMSVAELDSRMDDRFNLLTRRRGAVERHQSLRTTVSWSYDLLSETEQLLFDRLSVFAGGFDLPAAQSVAGVAPLTGTVDDGLASLVDKSLATTSRGPLGTRYQQLETLRQYGEERLAAGGGTHAARRRHLEHYLAWVERADAGLRSPDELRWHQAFQAEWHNVRNALGWACEIDDGDAACRLLDGALWWEGVRLGFEAADWCATVLALPSAANHPLRPRLIASASWHACMRRDLDGAEELMVAAWAEEARLGGSLNPLVPALGTGPDLIKGRWQQALVLAEETERRALAAGDEFFEVLGLAFQATSLGLGMAAGQLPPDEEPAAVARIRHAYDRAEAMSQPSAIAYTSVELGRMLSRSDPAGTLKLFERALALAGSLEVEITASAARAHLAALYTTNDRPDAALALLGAAIQRQVRAGAWLYVWTSLEPIPRPLADAGCPELAAVVIGACGQQGDSVAAGYTYLLARLADELGPEHLERLVEQGRRMTAADAARRVMQTIDELLA
ncbi:MAG TPA: adenylate/guanylate cyclase domain-containing protein [Acidimicrobiales bacterium]|nr:adenylate/guanylate cyclase domain-containing protein [Acidimicrobiales bacterium]